MSTRTATLVSLLVPRDVNFRMSTLVSLLVPCMGSARVPRFSILAVIYDKSTRRLHDKSTLDPIFIITRGAQGRPVRAFGVPVLLRVVRMRADRVHARANAYLEPYRFRVCCMWFRI